MFFVDTLASKLNLDGTRVWMSQCSSGCVESSVSVGSFRMSRGIDKEFVSEVFGDVVSHNAAARSSEDEGGVVSEFSDAADPAFDAKRPYLVMMLPCPRFFMVAQSAFRLPLRRTLH